MIYLPDVRPQRSTRRKDTLRVSEILVFCNITNVSVSIYMKYGFV